MKVFGYARTSTGDQDLGLDKQREKIRDHAEAEGYDLKNIHSNQVSGMKDVVHVAEESQQDSVKTPKIDLTARPGIQRVYRQGQIEDIDKLVVLNPSRLARNSRARKIIEFIFDEAGIEIEYIKVPDSWIGKEIQSTIYEYEARQTSKRTTEALEQKKRDDEWTGRPPTGFKTVEEHNKLEPEPYLEDLVMAVDYYNSTKLSREKVAKEYETVDAVTASKMRSLEKNMEQDKPAEKYVKGERPY